MTLEEKQREMKKRNAKKTRTGRPAKSPDFDHERFRKRIAAYVLLMRGYSAAQIASELQLKDVRTVSRWIDAKCPLLP
jgi:hypothetical protein